MMENIYYSPKGICKGLPAIKKLTKQAKVYRNKQYDRYIYLYLRK